METTWHRRRVFSSLGSVTQSAQSKVVYSHVYGNHDAGAGSGSARCQKNGFTDDVQHTFQVGYTHDCGGQYYVAIGKVASNPQPAKGPGKKCEVDADGWTRESYYYYYD